MRLRLVQIPAVPSLGVYPTYRLAAAVQERLRQQFLQAKSGTGDSPPPPPPPPTLLSFTPSPTYTLGRRQHAAELAPAALARLRAPLTVHVRQATHDRNYRDDEDDDEDAYTFVPAVESAPRGGLTTYHGPGQAVLWPVFDLKSPHHRRFTVRCYSRLLEDTTAAVLQARFRVDAYTTADPGLWVRSGGEERKIAALGVHLRRNIAALGVAVNLDTPVTHARTDGDADADEAVNPWARFVPCGLDGKGVTCVTDEGRLRFAGRVPETWDLRAPALAAEWASEFAARLGLPSDTDVVPRETVVQWIDEARQDLAAAAGEELDPDPDPDARRVLQE